MCYSAQIWADFRKYERFGGTLDIKAYMRLAGWTRRNGNWTKVVPKAMRRSVTSLRDEAPELAHLATLAEADGIVEVSHYLEAQLERQTRARAKLESGKPTKSAENELRVSTGKVAAFQRKLDDLGGPPAADGLDRIWPGHFAPVLIRDPESGERHLVPMRYRCRLPGWDLARELERPGTYNARRDKLGTVWRKVFGVHHGVIGVHRFFESVFSHDLEQRSLAPGEREQKVEIVFTPETGEDLLVACLWTYVEPEGDEPGFHSFAIITDHPPPEVAIAGHDRCIVSLQEEDLEAWLNPTAHTPAELQAILDRGEADRPYFEHALAA